MTNDVDLTTETPTPGRVVVVTGLSGAGRSTAADALEDLGWFVIDNLPPALIPKIAELAGFGRRVLVPVFLRQLAIQKLPCAGFERFSGHPKASTVIEMSTDTRSGAMATTWSVKGV